MGTTEEHDQVSDPQVSDLLRGAVDLHVHPSPSPFPRRIGIAAAAQQAADAGFRAILVKSHHHSMVSDIAAVDEAIGGLPIPVYSGVALNNYAGGINPFAAELALRQGGKIVWFPTISSAAHICVHEVEAENMLFPTNNLGLRHTAPLSILDSEGNVLPEVIDVLEVIRDADAIMSAGHLDADQTEELIGAAHRVGVTRILVNHPNFVIGADLDRVRHWITLGARIEHSLCQYDDRSTFYQWGLDVLLGYIEAAGVENTLLGSDLGQSNNPLPVQAYQRMIRALLDAGMHDHEVRALTSKNPAELLGI